MQEHKIRKRYHTILVGLIGLSALCTKAKESKLRGWYNTLFSGSTFHITLYYNALKYGTGCTFASITGGGDGSTVTLSKDSSGVITAIDDGRKTPLVLGSIPRTQKHIDKIRATFTAQKTAIIELFSLNRTFERKWSGLSKLVDKSNGTIKVYKYPTTDNTAPQLIDIIRAVRDLRTRDERKVDVAYVHCKAGRGRSAVVVAAYLVSVLHGADIPVSVHEIEHYLQRCRPQVKLGQAQKKLITTFKDILQDAGDFKQLCSLYQDALDQRDQQVYSED